jgi:hypothetical protein
MRMIAMKPYLTPILIILVLISGTLVSCGQKESTAKLIAYLDEEQPISERHVVTLQATSEAMKTISLEAKKPSPDDPSKTQLEAIQLPKPPQPTGIQRITVEAIKEALQAPKTPPEPIIPSGLKEALTSGVNTLDWALERMKSEILDYRKLSPPTEAATYHGLTVEVLLKEQGIYNDIRSNYKSLLCYGYSDVEALDRVKKELTERERLWSLCKYEQDELFKKVGK